MKALLITAILISFNTQAEVSTVDLELADQAIDAPTLNIEGQYQTKEVAIEEVKEAPVKKVAIPQKKVSASDRLKKYREQLEVRNRIMIEKKIEQIRFQQELLLAKKLEQSMNQTMKALDSAFKN